MVKSTLPRNPVDRFNPWVYFFIFLLSNTLLSYSTFPLKIKVWVGFLGIVVPFVIATLTCPNPPARETPPYLQGTLQNIPNWIWVFPLFLGIFLRFYHLTALSNWPITDEGWVGFFGLHLMKHWDHSLLYGVSQMPAGYFWGLAAVFRLLGVSLFSLWLYPAVLSLLTLVFLALTARKLFDGSFAFGYFSLAALSFWPLYCGRLSHPGMLAFFWESLGLWLLTGFLKGKKTREQWGWAVCLGFCVGAGFYTFTCWWGIGALLATCVGVVGYRRKTGGFKPVLGFLAALMGTAAPIWFDMARQNYGRYMSNLFLFQDMASLEYGWKASLSYITMLFWGADPLGQCYRPVWGGFLNPLLASVFFVGLASLVSHRKKSWSQWLMGAVVICLLPGLTTTSVEMYRTLPVLPFILMICCLGLSMLFPWERSKHVVAGFGFFLLLSTALDACHLFGSYHRIWGTPNPECADFKSVENWRAFDPLKLQSQEQGPGILFTDFSLKTFDQTLPIAGYSFDALRNPDLPVGKVKWFAVLVNPHFVPFLQKRFPESRWNWLSQGLSRPDGGLSLGIIPISPDHLTDLDPWMKANGFFRRFTLEMIFQREKRPGQEIIQELLGFETTVQGDPFLESCLWEKVEFYYVLMGDIDGAIHSIQKGLALGYPNAFFYDQMGLLLWRKNDLKGARFYFQKALKCPTDLTPASQNLKALEEYSLKTSPRPLENRLNKDKD
jgi:hypothetical protein